MGNRNATAAAGPNMRAHCGLLRHLLCVTQTTSTTVL